MDRDELECFMESDELKALDELFDEMMVFWMQIGEHNAKAMEERLFASKESFNTQWGPLFAHRLMQLAACPVSTRYFPQWLKEFQAAHREFLVELGAIPKEVMSKIAAMELRLD